MATLGMPPQARDPHMTTLHTAAVAIAVVSGICALVALAAGSPLQFGVALALFGTGWIAADFIESSAQRGQERAAHWCAVPVARPNPRYGSCRVVYVGGAEHFSQPVSRAGTELAA